MRHPVIPRSEMSPSQSAAHDELRRATRNAAEVSEPHIIMDTAEGDLIGPFAAIVRYPEVAMYPIQQIVAISKNGNLSSRLTETVILTVCAHTKASYMRYAHTALGRRAGLSEDDLEALCTEKCPADLHQEEKVAWTIARELSVRSGPLKEELWHEAVETLGLDRTSMVVMLTAVYAYFSVFMNGFDVPVPETSGTGITV